MANLARRTETPCGPGHVNKAPETGALPRGYAPGTVTPVVPGSPPIPERVEVSYRQAEGRHIYSGGNDDFSFYIGLKTPAEARAELPGAVADLVAMQYGQRILYKAVEGPCPGGIAYIERARF